MKTRAIETLKAALSRGSAWAEVCGIAAAGLVLGFVCNSANPIGLRPETASSTSAAPASRAVPSSTASSAPAPATGVSQEAARPAASPVTEEEAKAAHFIRDLPSRATWDEIAPGVASGRVLLVDARPVAAYQAGHIPGAESLPEKAPASAFAAFAARHGREDLLVTYCSDLSCSASMRLAQRLHDEFGFHHVRFLPGGYQEWQRRTGVAGAEPALTRTGASTGTSAAPVPAKSEVRRATRVAWSQVKPWIESNEVLLVDARPASAYAAGHIPGAVSLPEKSLPAVVARFAAETPKDRRIVTYCTDLSCSASMRLAQALTEKHGFQTVHYFPGGYQEWQRSQGLTPVPATSPAPKPVRLTNTTVLSLPAGASLPVPPPAPAPAPAPAPQPATSQPQ